jgi:hypothetical protein
VPGLAGTLDAKRFKQQCAEAAGERKDKVAGLIEQHCPPSAPFDEWKIGELSESAEQAGVDLSELLWKISHQGIKERVLKAIKQTADQRLLWLDPEKLSSMTGELLDRYCPAWDVEGVRKDLERRLSISLKVDEAQQGVSVDGLREQLRSALVSAERTDQAAEDALETAITKHCSTWNRAGIQVGFVKTFGVKPDLGQLGAQATADDLTAALVRTVEKKKGPATDRQRELISELTDRFHHSTEAPRWDLEGLTDELEEVFCERFERIRELDSRRELTKKILGIALSYIAGWDKAMSLERRLWVFRHLYLEEIDDQWIEHLKAMDHLREGIGLRGYGQRDPKVEYQREGFDMFVDMMQRIRENVASKLFRVRFEVDDEQDLPEFEHKKRHMMMVHAAAGGQQQQAQPVQKTVRRQVRKIRPNEPCPCGTGRKYKMCHMRKDQEAARRGELPEWAANLPQAAEPGTKKQQPKKKKKKRKARRR